MALEKAIIKQVLVRRSLIIDCVADESDRVRFRIGLQVTARVHVQFHAHQGQMGRLCFVFGLVAGHDLLVFFGLFCLVLFDAS